MVKGKNTNNFSLLMNYKTNIIYDHNYKIIIIIIIKSEHSGNSFELTSQLDYNYNKTCLASTALLLHQNAAVLTVS